MKTEPRPTARKEKEVTILYTRVEETLKDRSQREYRTISDVIEEAVLS